MWANEMQIITICEPTTLDSEGWDLEKVLEGTLVSCLKGQHTLKGGSPGQRDN